MTSIQPRNGPKGPAPDKRKDDAKRDEPDSGAQTEEEKIKREQATNPTLMPIGDPAGAA